MRIAVALRARLLAREWCCQECPTDNSFPARPLKTAVAGRRSCSNDDERYCTDVLQDAVTKVIAEGLPDLNAIPDAKVW